MEKQIMPNEMDYLLIKGKELTIQGILNDEVKEKIHFAAEKGVMNFGVSLEKSFKKDLSIQMTSFEVSNAKQFLEARALDLLAAFLFSVDTNQGKHLLMMTQADVIGFYEYVTGEVGIESLTENQLDVLATHFANALKNYYKAFSEEIKVSYSIKHELSQQFDCQQTPLEAYNFDVLNEVKVYEILTDVSKLHLVHLSDLDFLEYTYSHIEMPQEEVFIEDLIEHHTLASTQDHHLLTPTQEKSEPVAAPILKPQFGQFSEESYEQKKHNLGLLYDVPLELSVVLGKTKMAVKDVLELNTGKIIELNKYADDPLEIYANGKLIAEGEVVVVDENFGVRVTKLYQNEFQVEGGKR